MPESSSGTSRHRVIAALRAAGCVFAAEEAGLLMAAATSASELAAMVDRRISGVPLEQVLGWVEFCGLRIVVRPGVFVPRRRTEALVQHAVGLARPGAVVVDLCCGSGAIGAAVAQLAPNPIDLHACDLDPAAVECARLNVAAAGGHVYQGDLYEPLPAALRGQVDLLLVNAPYVPTDAIALMPPEARLYEPRAALDGGADGVDVHRRVAQRAADWLAPAGELVVETSERQAPTTVEALVRNGLTARVESNEKYGATMVIGGLSRRTG
jgi:release factor glutamine methyltransferase